MTPSYSTRSSVEDIILSMFREQDRMEVFEKEVKEDAKKEVARRLTGMSLSDKEIAYACELPLYAVEALRNPPGKRMEEVKDEPRHKYITGVAQIMIENGYPDDDIMRICELPLDEIQALRKESGSESGAI